MDFKLGENPLPLEVFRRQEIDQFNILLDVVSHSLSQLRLGIIGEVVMSSQLETMLNSFINKTIPENWGKYAYLSLKPLGSWFSDLMARLKFMSAWIKGDPKSFWLSCFFFPQGFLTAVK